MGRGDANVNSAWKWTARLTLLIIIVYTLGILLANTEPVVESYGVTPVNIALAVIIILSFFTTLRICDLLGIPFQGGGMRSAITVTFILMFLLLLITFGFGNYQRYVGPEQTLLGQSVFSQFGVLVGTVVGFYFAASAYVEARGIDANQARNGQQADGDSTSPKDSDRAD